MEADELSDFRHAELKDFLAPGFAALFLKIVFGGLVVVAAQEGVDDGAAFFCLGVFAFFFQILAIGDVAELLVNDETLDSIIEQEHLLGEGLFKSPDILFAIRFIDDGAIGVEFTLDAAIAEGKDSGGVDAVQFGIAFADAGPDFVQRTEVLELREREPVDDQISDAVFAFLLKVQIIHHFFCD